MPRLDAERIALWRRLQLVVADVERTIDAELEAEHGVPLTWFEAMSAIRAAGGSMRVRDLCEAIGDLASSLSRRLDRMEESGFVIRSATPTSLDRRCVTVASTPDGRAAWRDANVAYRRLVQANLAMHLTETDVAALARVLSKTGH